MNLNGTISGTANTTVTANMQRNDANAISVGDWYQLNVELTVPESYVAGGGGSNDFQVYLQGGTGSADSAWFDDLMVHPVDAPISANVYDNKTGRLIATLDNNNFYTKFELDESGRNKAIYKEVEGAGEILLKRFNYHFVRN